jgi:hypothetical protein
LAIRPEPEKKIIQTVFKRGEYAGKIQNRKRPGDRKGDKGVFPQTHYYFG